MPEKLVDIQQIWKKSEKKLTEDMLRDEKTDRGFL
jgi:hypothetical protein